MENLLSLTAVVVTRNPNKKLSHEYALMVTDMLLNEALQINLQLKF